MQLVVSLFPGMGLLDLAFEQTGFTVVRGPDLLWGGDIKLFHPPAGRFEGLIGGPPCQPFSQLIHIVKHNGYQVADDLIPEFERVVGEAQPTWFLMENTKAAPLPVVAGYTVSAVLLNNRWFGGEQNRKRRFSLGLKSGQINWWEYLEIEALENIDYASAVLASGYRTKHNARINKSGPTRASVAEAVRLQGLPVNFFKHSPLTVKGQQKMLGNGVPLPMGLAVAKVVKEVVREQG